MNTPVWQLKKTMCDIGQRIWQRAYCAGNEGNHSVRIGENRLLCTPSGLSKGFLAPEDICVVDMAGKQVEANPRGRVPTSEILVHLAVYKTRPDVQAVIHSHSPHATAFAIANMPIPQGIHPEAEIFLGKVPIARYATPSTQQLSDSIMPLIGPETNSIIMGNHGSISFSNKDLVEAYYLLEILDAYCRLLLLASQIGRVNVLKTEQMADLLNVKTKFGLTDDRIACIDDGCVGTDNEPYLASIDVRPASATCACNGGHVDSTQRTGAVIDQPVANDVVFEDLVRTITDQIVSATGH